MNNKGFGIPQILAFAILTIVVIYFFNVFVTSISGLFDRNLKYANYKNVYKKFLTSSSIVVPKKETNEFSSYEEMEIKIADSSKSYIEALQFKIEEDKAIYVNLDTLKEKGFIEPLKDLTNPAVYCLGYAKIINTKDLIIYKGYLMCGNNYKTIGYNSKYA
ncbi:MAG: hypothetical protein RR659_00880, partial [Bacilli bacterium]